MTTFACENCNYQFKSEKVERIYPYCGKKELLKELSAEDLLKNG
ncbi:MAG: hypothetical protein QF567_02630 [Candidatus Pacearchaeota archaeon]|jgi:RNA polymerase subunit RPABC4/transcription elongation factor Spt4|nr:hypothetical protein [Candidatus Pacearchaeota archaeon]|tara:strand:- start:525 stop:656 length:132 start_codon:yes stop_codon:yes gene_type:complete